MKIVNLFNDFRPCRKCGAETAALAILGGSAAAGAANSAIGNAIGAGNVSSQLSAQKEENQLNRDWQTAEAEKARQFSAGQTLQQNEFVSGLQAQQQQYNLQSMREQARLNSPVYQRQQLEAAGINPEVYFGNSSSFSGVSAQSGGAPSAPSPAGTHGVGSVPGLSPIAFQPRDLQLGLYGTQLAQQIKDLADAKKTGVETGLLPDEIAARIRSLNTQSSLNEVLSVGQDISNKLNRERLPYAYKMAALEVEQSVADLKLTEQNRFTAESVAKVNAALESLHKAQENLTSKESEKLGIEMPLYFQYLKSSINKNVAEAVKASAEAQTENSLREYKINLSDNQIKSVDWTNREKAVNILRKFTGMSDSLWNDIYNQLKKAVGIIDEDKIIEWLRKNGVDR